MSNRPLDSGGHLIEGTRRPAEGRHYTFVNGFLHQG
jgi:hypothetical protein